MNSEVKISVIIPAYNVSDWLERCLNSIVNQTYKNLEIIVINDGSTDGTAEIINRYAAEDQRIIAVHQNNTGLVEVRERGISMATGEYTGFVDGDDEIDLKMYERLLKNALDYGAEISQCGILYCFYDGRRKPIHGTGELHIFNRIEGYRELLSGKRIEPSLCNKIYKTELLKDSCPDKTIINNEDYLRNSVLFSRCTISIFEDFCGYHYWRHSESMSNNSNIVKVGANLLRARKLIFDNSIDELKPEALESYLNAVISVYNSTLFKRNEDVKALRIQCKRLLSEYEPEIGTLSKSLRKRSMLILKAPILHKVAYKLHIHMRNRRIKREATKLKTEM